MIRRPAVAAAVALLLAPAAPSTADWLVARDGGRVETKGPWQVKGKLVVFTGANGALASLRLADVDLAASETATREAREAQEAAAAQPEPQPPPRKKSIRSLTDADFSRKPPADEAAASPEEAAAPGDEGAKPKEPKAARESPVVVSSWSQANRTEGDGIDLYGTLQNPGTDLVTDVVVKVKLLNEQNEVVGTADGVLASTSMPAGGTTSFRVPFSGVFAFEKAEFAVSSKSIITTPDPAKQQAPPAAAGH